ncbi:MAG: phosphatase PAP2 family protein [Gaiellales bacterium]
MSEVMSERESERERTGLAARILPKGWRDFIWQLALFTLVDIAYEATRGHSLGSVQTAFRHAQDMVSWERSLGIFTELDVQHWVLARPWALSVADFTYFHAHFVITTVFLFWLYLRRNRHYYFIRNAIFAADAIALIGFTFFPTAPPRLLTYLGFTDTLDRYASVNVYSGPIKDLANPYAAVPSIHTCYALITALTCFFLVKRTPVRFAWLLYPVLIVFSIVATGNHFWLDALLGATTALIALGAAWLIERLHPTLPNSARRRMRLAPVASST